MRFAASELFTLRNVGSRSGKPEWANQRAYRQRSWKGAPESLAGPGIYGLFFKERLFYIGIFAGAARDPFRGSVLDRWQKHVTYQFLRAPVISFARGELRDILTQIDGPVRDEIARCLPDGASTDCATLDRDHPLIGGGTCCTFRKARFAARNWDAIGPEAGDRFLEHVSFVYQRIPKNEATLTFLEGADDAQRRKWIKHEWLATRERDLIEALRPICNSEIDPGTERSDVDPDTFKAALGEALAGTPLAPFKPRPDSAVAAERSTSSHQPGGAADPGPASAMPDPAAEVDPVAEDQDDAMLAASDTSVEEQRFRRNLPPGIEALIDDLEEDCPTRFATYFTSKPDFRVALRYADGRNERVLLRLYATRQILHCETLASVAACQAFGFEARPLEGTPMNAAFDIDPAEHGISDLFAVAGAAVQTLRESV